MTIDHHRWKLIASLSLSLSYSVSLANTCVRWTQTKDFIILPSVKERRNERNWLSRCLHLPSFFVQYDDHVGGIRSIRFHLLNRSSFIEWIWSRSSYLIKDILSAVTATAAVTVIIGKSSRRYRLKNNRRLFSIRLFEPIREDIMYVCFLTMTLSARCRRHLSRMKNAK